LLASTDDGRQAEPRGGSWQRVSAAVAEDRDEVDRFRRQPA